MLFTYICRTVTILVSCGSLILIKFCCCSDIAIEQFQHRKKCVQFAILLIKFYFLILVHSVHERS
jgi:hypothetical protein